MPWADRKILYIGRTGLARFGRQLLVTEAALMFGRHSSDDFLSVDTFYYGENLDGRQRRVR